MNAEQKIADQINQSHLRELERSDRRCRGTQLPDGIMLRYTMAGSLYFYLLTSVSEGNISTRVFASDSPYDRQKAAIGQARTPMFDPDADRAHLEKLKAMLHKRPSQMQIFFPSRQG